jgi:hypothetical protein
MCTMTSLRIPNPYDDSAFAWDAANWHELPAPTVEPMSAASESTSRSTAQREALFEGPSIPMSDAVQREVGFSDRVERFPSPEAPRQDLFSALESIGWGGMDDSSSESDLVGANEVSLADMFPTPTHRPDPVQRTAQDHSSDDGTVEWPPSDAQLTSMADVLNQMRASAEATTRSSATDPAGTGGQRPPQQAARRVQRTPNKKTKPASNSKAEDNRRRADDAASPTPPVTSTPPVLQRSWSAEDVSQALQRTEEMDTEQLGEMGIDMDQLAEDVFKYLKDKLRVEWERHHRRR